MNLKKLKSVFSFHYDDRPMPDCVYEGHVRWLRYVSDYYHRIEHHGFVQESIDISRKESVLFISNHAILLEAAILGYYLITHGSGKLATMVFPEAFKIPLIREFLRSCQCVPISVDNGAHWLKKRHLLIFPEGMDFISRYTNPDRVPAFHKGFLRMAKQYLRKTGKKSVTIIPVAHTGFEDALKLWVIKNKFLVENILHRFVHYPYFAFPKLPFLWPSKVVFYWGYPTRVTLRELSTEKKISKKMNEFRAALIHQKLRAQQERDTVRF